MARIPGTPKAKTGAPAQFDMNSRERKGGGKGGRGGPGRDREAKRAPSHIMSLIFEGHDPLVFGYLSAARDRAKEPPTGGRKAFRNWHRSNVGNDRPGSTD